VGLAKFRQAGLEGVRAEPYVVANAWLPGEESGEVVAPARSPLRVAALPFVAGTGPRGIEAEVVDAGRGDEPGFAAAGGKIRGRWILVHTEPMQTLADLFGDYMATPPAFDAARKGGAAGILWMSMHTHRMLSRHPVRLDDTIDPLPGAMIDRESALRIARQLARGIAVRVKIVTTPRVVRNAPAENVVAEVRGSEKPDEVVVLGAHLDSWDLGRGALDNGCNAALVVDAARQIAAAARLRRPRRTLRFVLYTGEEVGLIGSFAEVRAGREVLDRIAAMVTFDIGTGRTTGFSTGGRPDIAAAADAALAPAASLGPFTQTNDAFLGTDNYDFLVEGVPTFVANQDGAPYTPDYHAESDTFDKVDVRELKADTAIAAVFVWDLADAAARPGPRQSHAEIEALAKATGLDQQMKVFGLWYDFVAGRRGRK